MPYFLKYLITFLTLIVFFVAGFLVSDFGLFTLQPPQPTYEQGYEAGLSYARERLGKAGFPVAGQGPLYSISGRIVAVDSSSAVIEYDLASIDLLKEGTVQTKVILADQGVIQRYTRKDPGDIKKSEPIIQQMFSVATLSFQDLQKDDSVRVESDADIQNADVIQAKFITLSGRSSENPTPPADQSGQLLE